jgi:hypothetical protein
MEMEIPEFEEYLLILKRELRLNDITKKEIGNEIYLNLYDKYNEFLIKGYGITHSIKLTLENFEDPRHLAGMLNKSYNKTFDTGKLQKISYSKIIAIAAAITILMLLNIIS